MKRNLIAFCILAFSLAGVGFAQGTDSSAQNGAQLTKAQLKQLLQSAHTPDQYRALADYYGQQERTYMQQATAERLEWIRRGQNTTAVAAKYPRPVDSARYLYESYAYKESEAGKLANKFGHMAAPEIAAK